MMKSKMAKIKKVKRLRASLKEKGCAFCKEKWLPTWKDYEKLGQYLSPRSRILGSNMTGICSRHQRKLVKALKQARHLALLPFITE